MNDYHENELEKRLLNVSEAARYLGIKESRLRRAVARKEIPFIKIGRLVRFGQFELDQWISDSIKKDRQGDLV